MILGGLIYWGLEEPEPEPGSEPETEPNPVVNPETDSEEVDLLADEYVWAINFNDSSLDVDVGNTGDDSFIDYYDGSSHGNYTLHDGYVTSSKPLELNNGFPSVLNYGGSQSWIINFNTTLTENTMMVLSTSPVGPTSTALEYSEYFDAQTGIFLRIKNNYLDCQIFSGEGERVGRSFYNLGTVLENITHSCVIVIDYESVYPDNNKIHAYFDGVLVVTGDIMVEAGANNGYVLPVSWSNADNIHINAFHNETVSGDCSYHKLAVVHRVLTPQEILNEWNSITNT